MPFPRSSEHEYFDGPLGALDARAVLATPAPDLAVLRQGEHVRLGRHHLCLAMHPLVFAFANFLGARDARVVLRVLARNRAENSASKTVGLFRGGPVNQESVGPDCGTTNRCTSRIGALHFQVWWPGV